MPASGSDVDEIGKAKNGDVEAFASLYDRHADRVYRYILYFTSQAADSEDLTQQVFVKAWQAIGRYQVTEVPFRAWLLAIAHNLVVSYFRSRHEHQPLDDELGWADEKMDVAGFAERRDLQAAVRRAIRRLKPEQQRVVSMRYLEDLDYSAIARATGKTEGNVRVILHRGLRELRALLGDL
ncbi:MAG: RNA polymerase sigma factor [Chloroflexota bacterium]